MSLQKTEAFMNLIRTARLYNFTLDISANALRVRDDEHERLFDLNEAGTIAAQKWASEVGYERYKQHVVSLIAALRKDSRHSQVVRVEEDSVSPHWLL